jgi:NADH-quinone oxidoreductase subunit N
MEWMNAAPEIFCFAAGLWFLLASLGARGRRGHVAALFLSSVLVLVCLLSLGREGFFTGLFHVDLFSQVFKTLIAIGLFLIVCICDKPGAVSPDPADSSLGPDASAGVAADAGPHERGEFYFLLFTGTLALMLLASACHLLSIYLSLELSSYSLYILVALRRDESLGLEAGIKYFLIGSFASAVMLFGMALLYSTAGSAYLADISKVMPALLKDPGAVIGILFILGGFFFKLAVFPFHFWAPDTYQGAANHVAAYIATASKVAAIAVMLRVLAFTGQGIDYLAHALAILAVVSMTLGNLAAIVQKDFKRLLAFSTIAHSGYVLIGVLVLSPEGYAGVIFYAVALLIMKFTAFMVLAEVATDGGNLRIEELAGLHRRSPILALALLVSLFSLAGIPPTIGFTGKFLVFLAAVQKGYLALVIIAMINVVISLYYYLLAIRAAYLLEPAREPPPLSVSFPAKLLAGLSTAVIVFAGFFPSPLIELARAAARTIVWK